MSLTRHANLLPRTCSRHREAAIALFRALLTSCRAVPNFTSAQRQELQNVVRNRFKEQRHTHSERWLRLRFVAGYQGLDVLDAAHNGDLTKRDYILSLLDQTPARTKSPPPASNGYPLHVRRLLAKQARQAARAKLPQYPRVSITDRPLPRDQLSGKRHVPHLVAANKIPMLLIKKPMPPNLASYFAKRIKTRQKRFDARDASALAMIEAGREDAWDEMMERLIKTRDQMPTRRHSCHDIRRGQHSDGEFQGKCDRPGQYSVSRETHRENGVERDGISWQQAIVAADRRRSMQWDKEALRNRTMAATMQSIVDKETALAMAERDEDKLLRRGNKVKVRR